MAESSRLAFLCGHTTDDSGGVFVYDVADDGATLHERSRAPGSHVSYLAVHIDGRYCYAVDNRDGGDVTAYRVDESAGELVEINRQSTHGGDACYVSVDATGQYAFVSNYGGGSVAMFPVEDDGGLGEATDVVEHEGNSVDPERQTDPHPHSIGPGPDNRFAYAPDLGADRVAIYEIDFAAGELVAADAPDVRLHEGAGPRHFEFHPDGQVAYVINELDSTITTFERDAETGALDAIDTVSTLPEGYDEETYTADIHVHPSGEWVFGSNRGHDSIAVFGVENDGTLSPVGHEPTGGNWPRDFALAPDGSHLYAENQNSDSVVVFAVDEATGELRPTGDELGVPGPLCLKFLDGV